MERLVIAFTVAIVLFFAGMVFTLYINSYNRAMVACLAEHSKDVCVETLK